MKACVIGWPISHSRSPLIHGYWIKTHGLNATYTKLPVEPPHLAAFFQSLQSSGYNGCNVTIPHKEATFRLVDIADAGTGRLGAINTVFIREGRLMGTNTDGEGFLNSLTASVPNFSLANTKAVILGAGGAAASVTDVLLRRGVSEILIVNRSEERAVQLCRRFGKTVKPVPWDGGTLALAEAGMLVNTTSLGMSGQPNLNLDLSHLPSEAVVTDIVYSPLVTPLLKAARQRGNPTVEGLGMLLHQAVRGFELWFGVRPVVTQALHDFVARDIDPDYGLS